MSGDIIQSKIAPCDRVEISLLREAILDFKHKNEELHSRYTASQEALAEILIEHRKQGDAGRKILEGFDKGFFVRSIFADQEDGWAIKLLPYLAALAVFTKEKRDD